MLPEVIKLLLVGFNDISTSQISTLPYLHLSLAPNVSVNYD